MIYLYVVGFRQPGKRDWFHTFWTKDCAVAEVEMEEHGSPAQVECLDFALPELYRSVTVEGETRPINRSTFTARVDGEERWIELRWEVGGLPPGTLRWATGTGWELMEGGLPRGVRPDTRIVFSRE